MYVCMHTDIYITQFKIENYLYVFVSFLILYISEQFHIYRKNAQKVQKVPICTLLPPNTHMHTQTVSSIITILH